MKKLFLIKRKRELIIEVCVKEEDRRKTKRGGKDRRAIPREEGEVTSVIMISRRIDEFEVNIRRKMESEMRIFSCKTHSQEFLRSLIPSFNKDRKC